MASYRKLVFDAYLNTALIVNDAIKLVFRFGSSEFLQNPPRWSPPGRLLAGREGSLWSENGASGDQLHTQDGV